jgi:diadenosine tetraphosphate (Ap4A) HIT family hydrolase
MENIKNEKHCPFCEENLRKYHKEPILKEGKYWILTKNQWPYKGTKLHLLAILKKHAERLGELTPEEGAELFELFQWAERSNRVLGGGFAMRFGDMRYSGGTVRHLHAQFIVPDVDNPDAEPVRFKIGQSKKK